MNVLHQFAPTLNTERPAGRSATARRIDDSDLCWSLLAAQKLCAMQSHLREESRKGYRFHHANKLFSLCKIWPATAHIKLYVVKVGDTLISAKLIIYAQRCSDRETTRIRIVVYRAALWAQGSRLALEVLGCLGFGLRLFAASAMHAPPDAELLREVAREALEGAGRPGGLYEHVHEQAFLDWKPTLNDSEETLNNKLDFVSEAIEDMNQEIVGGKRRLEEETFPNEGERGVVVEMVANCERMRAKAIVDRDEICRRLRIFHGETEGHTVETEGQWMMIGALEKTKGTKLINKIKQGQTRYKTKKDEKGNTWVYYFETKEVLGYTTF